jgi:hypothetical protein
MVFKKLIEIIGLALTGNPPASLELYPCEGSYKYPKEHTYLVDEILTNGKPKKNVEIMNYPEFAQLPVKIKDEYRQCPACRFLNQNTDGEIYKTIDELLTKEYPNFNKKTLAFLQSIPQKH